MNNNHQTVEARLCLNKKQMEGGGLACLVKAREEEQRVEDQLPPVQRRVEDHVAQQELPLVHTRRQPVPARLRARRTASDADEAGQEQRKSNHTPHDGWTGGSSEKQGERTSSTGDGPIYNAGAAGWNTLLSRGGG